MAVQHTNRKGDVYHLLSKKTKTGKTTYYFSRKATGTSIEELPEGFEIFEDPATAQVYLRKAKPTSITPAERELVQQSIRDLAGIKQFQVVVDGDSLVVYTADTDPERALDILGGFAPFTAGHRDHMRDWIVGHATYSKMMRFTLHDPETRQFLVERWCFRGAIDNWFFLDGPAPLDVLAKKYVRHLGKESFFELM